MAKAIRHFIGTDTMGRPVERAQREDGVWFARHTIPNGQFGNRICAWYQVEASEFFTTVKNQYSGETLECEPYMCWGFQRMRELTAAPLRLRLPNP